MMVSGSAGALPGHAFACRLPACPTSLCCATHRALPHPSLPRPAAVHPPGAGYLTRCSLWSDSNGDGLFEDGEPIVTVTGGQWAFASTATASTLGVLHLATADEATTTVGG